MRHLLTSVLLLASSVSFAASIPNTMTFPVKNGAAGEVYKMQDHPNSVFVFEAFRLTCSYCNQNAPRVDRLAEENRANPRVEVLDLSLDTADYEFAEWIRLHKPNHKVIQDVGRNVYKALKTIDGIPQAFVVDCKGNMHGNVFGAWDANAEKKVRDLIASALKVTCE